VILIHVDEWTPKNVLQNFYPETSSKPTAAYSKEERQRWQKLKVSVLIMFIVPRRPAIEHPAPLYVSTDT
jgi:hypothetical protein